MDIRDFLKQNGYLNSHPDTIHREATVHYKRVHGTVKHQVEVVEWPSLTIRDIVTAVSFDVTMTFETEYGCWATTKFYGLSAEKLVEVLPRLEASLKQSMVYMGANPLHYRFDGED